MTNDAFKDIEKLEADLCEAADNLLANSKLTSSDYFMPVLAVIFLRHAANRFEAARRQIKADQASGRMPQRKVLPANYIARRAFYLPEKARYDLIMEQGGRKWPGALAGDPGMSVPQIRRWLAERSIDDGIPYGSDELARMDTAPVFERERYKQRNAIERLIGWTGEFRRIAMRHE